MIKMNVEELVTATSGKLVKGDNDHIISGISIDTRSIKTGDLFIPIIGQTDGHKYVEQALDKGAGGVLVANGHENKDRLLKRSGTYAVIEVEDTLKAFQDIAQYYRVTHLKHAKVIGITGSSGKTTTKDMISCILSQRFRIISTDKNYNNELGVPLTILRADPEADVLIVEMGMRGPGQIRELALIAHPDIGVITNIGQAHVELLGSEENIANAKAELVLSLPERGVAILNADDLWTPQISKCACSKITTYGITAGDIKGTRLEVDNLGRTSFKLIVRDGASYGVRLPMPGRHNVYNALAAAAAAVELGFSEDEIRIGLVNCRLSPMRMEILTSHDNVIILNDAYNANPASMQAALATLTDIKVEGRHIAVIGDMLELGASSHEAHMMIGEQVASLGINVLVTVGSESEVIANRAVSAGMNSKAVVLCSNAKNAAQIVKQLAEPGDVVLVKASRGVGLEEVVKALVKI